MNFLSSRGPLISTGDINFNQENADRCEVETNRLSEGTACEDIEHRLFLVEGTRAIEVCDQLYSGALQENHRCRPGGADFFENSHCPPDLVSSSGGMRGLENFTCRPQRRAGEGCIFDEECAVDLICTRLDGPDTVCQAPAQFGERGGTSDDCVEGLVCTGEPFRQVCRVLNVIGLSDACELTAECMPGLFCVAPRL